jgi:tetratricopeptide (TPR) repeat protein
MQKGAKKAEPIKPKSGKNILYLYCAILSIVIVGLYSGITSNNFVDLDDTTVIVDNYPFLKDFSNAPQAFKQGVFQVYDKQDTLKTYYRPIMTLSFMVDAHLSPAPVDHVSPRPFLRANIFYHILACILLLLLFTALKINPVPAFLLTLLFAVHPILAQAIAWIPGRNDPLVAIFILAAMLSLLKYTETKKAGYIALHLLFFILALFTKENAIMLIGITAFCFYRLNKTTIRKRESILFFSGYGVIIVVWYFMRSHAIASSGPDMSLAEATKNIMSNLPMFFQYIGKSLIPYGLSVLSTVKDTNYLLGILGIVIIVVGIMLSKEKKWDIIILGLLWFFLFLTPSFLTQFSGLEHRDYLPLIGLVIVASEMDIIKKLSFQFNWQLAAMGLIIVSFIVVTHNRLPVFNNCFNFDKSAMETSPKNVLPCLYLAKHYEETHQYNEAIGAYTEALKRDSNTPMMHNNIGGEYIAMNKYPEAEEELKKEIAKFPNNSFAVFNLGLINYTYQRDSIAVNYWKRALQINPGFMNPHKMLAEYYAGKGDSIHAAPYRKWLKDKGYPTP